MTPTEMYAEADWWASRAVDLPDDADDCRRIASLLRLLALRAELSV